MVELMFGNPLKSFAQGSEIAQQMQRSQMDTQQKGMQTQIMAQQMPAQNALYELSQKENQTYDDYQQLQQRYPQLYETLSPMIKNMDERTATAATTAAAPIMAAFNNGNITEANRLIEEQEQGYTNAGNLGAAKNFTMLKQLLKTNSPAFGIGMNTVLYAMKPELAEQTFKTRQADALQQNAQTNQYKALNDAQNNAFDQQDKTQKRALEQERLALDTTTAGNNLAIEQQKAGQKNQELALGKVQKVSAADMQKSFDASEEATQKGAEVASAIQVLNDNAKKYSWGTNAAQFSQWLNQDPNAQIVQEAYTGARHQKIASKLFTGAQSDADIALAQQGLPPINATPQMMMSYLKGVQKIYEYDAEYQHLRGLWLQQEGITGAASKDLEIGGQVVPKGTTFKDYWADKSAAIGTAVNAAKTKVTDADRLKFVPAATKEDLDAYSAYRKSNGGRD